MINTSTDLRYVNLLCGDVDSLRIRIIIAAVEASYILLNTMVIILSATYLTARIYLGILLLVHLGFLVHDLLKITLISTLLDSVSIVVSILAPMILISLLIAGVVILVDSTLALVTIVISTIIILFLRLELGIVVAQTSNYRESSDPPIILSTNVIFDTEAVDSD